MSREGFKLVARLVGTLLVLMAVAMLLPTAVSLHTSDGVLRPLLLSTAILLVAGLILRCLVGHNARYELRERESFWITAAIWITIPLSCTLPYLLSGSIEGFTDAAFESVSGFTTTGSSILPDPAALPQSLLLWRALSQWMGGLGLVLLVVALIRRLQRGSLHLYDAEFSGTQQRKLHPRISRSVSRMWHIYALLTILLAALMILLGNPSVDSLCLAMSTVSTGGFMTSLRGLTDYSSSTHLLLTLFMFFSGTNMALLYNLFTLRWRQLHRNDEFRLYLLLYLLATAACTLAFGLNGNPWPSSAQYTLFHIASTISTCGFYTAEPPHWPLVASVVTFLLMLSGACAGSTGGGIKLRRLMTLFLYLRNYFTRMIHPNAVFVIKIDRQTVPPTYVRKTFGFVFLYICTLLLGATLLTLCHCGIAQSFCLAAANISNLGPSPIINTFGTNLDYSLLPNPAKWTLIALMLAGRLEIFALLAILTPSYWKQQQ